MSASLASLSKTGWRMSASLASPSNTGCRISSEYSNSINSLSSGHCLVFLLFSGPDSTEQSFIVAGGTGTTNEALSLVEFIDLDSDFWRQGPDLPQKITSSAMVQHPNGGVILVGGSDGNHALNTLFHLPHAGEGVKWIELPIKLKNPRFGHVAMTLPAAYVSCNKTINNPEQ